MSYIIRNSTTVRRALHELYLIVFIFGVGLALPLYTNSSFLATFLTENIIGLLYAVSSLLAIFILAVMPAMLTRIGNYRTSILLVAGELAALVAIAVLPAGWWLVPVFILFLAFEKTMLVNLDIFLEYFTRDAYTGRVRGMFLTILNLAILITPFLTGLLLDEGDYWKTYLLAAFFFAIMHILLHKYFRTFKDPTYHRIPFWKTLRELFRNKSLRNVFSAQVLLEFFFAWMVIYMPIYLHTHIGFSWSTIGVVFTIMLLPFVLFELPAGGLADRKFGERELMGIGFAVMSLACVGIAFIASHSVVIWTIALFISRIGASIVEVTTESAFFKHVNSTDANLIGFFRNARPAAYIIAPLAASIFLSAYDVRYLFFVLGLVVVFGAALSRGIAAESNKF